jgi:hypothetical protein
MNGLEAKVASNELVGGKYILHFDQYSIFLVSRQQTVVNHALANSPYGTNGRAGFLTNVDGIRFRDGLSKLQCGFWWKMCTLLPYSMHPWHYLHIRSTSSTQSAYWSSPCTSFRRAYSSISKHFYSNNF